MPQFVVLTHDHPTLHWDFMLETPELLRTWRLSHPPDSVELITAEPLGDHRRIYLDYEGPVSGDRGEVTRWDAGDYRLIDDSDSRFVVRLSGMKLCGTATIAQSASDTAGTFHFTAD